MWVTEAHHRELWALLHYDKRTTQNSANGRCLLQDYPPLHLCAYDRLEPSANLVDVGKWEDLVEFPVRLIFWRCSRESVARHRNPLWDPTIGLTVESFYFDILHTLYLGVLNAMAKELIWELMDKDVWQTHATTLDERVALSVGHLRRSLFNFYSDFHRRHPDRKLTELQDLTVKMMGKSTQHKLKVKGMECWGVVLFLPTLLSEYGGALGERRRAWEVAVENVIAHVELIRQYKNAMPPLAVQGLYDTHARVMNALMSLGDFSFTPKFHVWMHIIASSLTRGSPWVAAAFLDEGYNHTLKKASKGAHAAVFEKRVLRRIDISIVISIRRSRRAD